MKNQFFADKHDYFKYDLWLQVAEAKRVKSLTFIPMLTPNDTTKEGRRVSYQEGKRRKRLYCFLQFCLVPKRRSITRLREFLCDEPFEYHPYRDDDDKGFQDGSWNAYFNAVPHEWLSDAAILIDPDTGMETKKDFWKRDPEKYITYQNIATVVSRCSGDSVVVVFQFLQKMADLRERDLEHRRERLQETLCSGRKVGGLVHWIAEKTSKGLGDLAFFVIGIGPDRPNRLEILLKDYAEAHGLCVGPPKVAQGIAAL
ncbi:MAG: hypothetical protein ACLQVL_06735 [Terriglobia bacterium]